MNIREIMAAAEQGLGPMAVESAGTSQGACERHRRLGHKLGPECGGSGGGATPTDKSKSGSLARDARKLARELYREAQGRIRTKNSEDDNASWMRSTGKRMLRVAKALKAGNVARAEALIREHASEAWANELAEKYGLLSAPKRAPRPDMTSKQLERRLRELQRYSK